MCLSKPLSGSGNPLLIVLIRPDTHSGTFRGNNLALVTAAAMCKMGSGRQFTAGLAETTVKLQGHLDRLAAKFPDFIVQKRGRGLLAGLKCCSQDLVARVHDLAFEGGLLIESSGPNRDVVKLFPPITITESELDRTITILNSALQGPADGRYQESRSPAASPLAENAPEVSFLRKFCQSSKVRSLVRASVWLKYRSSRRDRRGLCL